MKFPLKLAWLFDEKDAAYLKQQGTRLPKNSTVLKYENLTSNINSLKRQMQALQTDAIMYSRNEQISNVKIGNITNALQTGYCSISGIDKDAHFEQMKTCLLDYTNGGGVVEVPKLKKIQQAEFNTSKGTFSLVFDLEQLGGAKFGMPRILKILNQYQIPATFFATSIVLKTYPYLQSSIKQAGHEIAIHGLYHEDLRLDTQEKQIYAIKEMMKTTGQVFGANFISRMNNITLDALIENKIQYFVFPYKNTNKYLATYFNPITFQGAHGMITGVPIFAETYNKPLEKVIKQINNTLAHVNSKAHITLLLHPFRDGAESKIGELEQLIQYMQKQNYTSITTLMAVKLYKQENNCMEVRKLKFRTKNLPEALITRLWNNKQLKHTQNTRFRL